MKITLEIPVDDVPFILSGSLKPWLKYTSVQADVFVPPITAREGDALVRLVEAAVCQLEVEPLFEVPAQWEAKS